MASGPKALVERFYHVVWNRADEAAAHDLLTPDFRFRGSLGPERRGADGFIAYLRAVHAALGHYTCTIENLIVEGERAAARMRFEGIHRGRFLGVAATGRTIIWAGAAFFRMDGGRIASLWVLGDTDAIRRQLGLSGGTAFDG